MDLLRVETGEASARQFLRSMGRCGALGDTRHLCPPVGWKGRASRRDEP